jgi:hypothetical protein
MTGDDSIADRINHQINGRVYRIGNTRNVYGVLFVKRLETQLHG